MKDRLDAFYQNVLPNEIDNSKALRKLCECSYWSRRWIVQEAMLGSAVKMICGDESLSLETLGALFDILDLTPLGHLSHLVRDVLTAVQSSIPHQIWKDRDQRFFVSGRRMLLTALLESYRSTTCTLVFDRIFSLVALATGVPFPIDYSMTALELFAHVLRRDSSHYRFESGVTPVLAETLGLSLSPSVFSYDWDAKHIMYSAQVQSCVLNATPTEILQGWPSNSSASTDREFIGRDECEDLVAVFPFNLGMLAHVRREGPSWRRSHAQGHTQAIWENLLAIKRRLAVTDPQHYCQPRNPESIRVDRIFCNDGRVGLTTGPAERGDFVCRYDKDKDLLLRANHVKHGVLDIVGMIQSLKAAYSANEELETEVKPDLLEMDIFMTPRGCGEALEQALELVPEAFQILKNPPRVDLYLESLELVHAFDLWH